MITLEGKKYYIHTFGCQMNVRESETAAGILQSLGMQATQTMEDAHVILFNTCCIRDLAERKAWGAIGASRTRKQEDPQTIIGVFGCMMAQEGANQEVKKRFPFVDIVFGTNSLHELKPLLEQARRGMRVRKGQVGDAQEEFALPVFHNSKPSAFVNIIHGCNNFCSYCIVPYVRGREKSRPMTYIVQEVEELVAQGYQEVTLLGQNVNSYGKDTGDASFAELLRRLDQTGMPRIRFMTSHPKDLTEELIDTIADCKSVCKQIHLPVQSGSNAVLKAMNRKYTREHYLHLIERIRYRMPECGITTDFIVGFPSETEADFQQTLDLVRQVRFDTAFMFAFSPRKGTPAARMEGALSAEEKQRRLAELIAVQREITMDVYKSLVGREEMVLIEHTSRRSDKQLTGKDERGRTVNLNGDLSLIGQMVPVRIVRANANSVFAERIG